MPAIRLVCLTLLVSMVGALSAGAAEVAKESLAKVKENIDMDKAVLVDVREEREWHSGHIEGALCLPLSRLQNGAAGELVEQLPKGKIIYTHCVVGRRAVTAGDILERMGYEVRPLRPGIRELISAGFPHAR